MPGGGWWSCFCLPEVADYNLFSVLSTVEELRRDNGCEGIRSGELTKVIDFVRLGVLPTGACRKWIVKTSSTREKLRFMFITGLRLPTTHRARPWLARFRDHWQPQSHAARSPAVSAARASPCFVAQRACDRNSSTKVTRPLRPAIVRPRRDRRVNARDAR